jgi:type IV secretion/conjugal transfer VirB4 family ATPase
MSKVEQIDRVQSYRVTSALDKYVPYSALVAPDTALTKDGEYCVSWEVDGLSFEGMSDDMLDDMKIRFNNFIMTCGQHITIWSHVVKVRARDRLDSKFPTKFAQELDRKYQDKYSKSPLTRTRLFVTLAYKPYSNAFVRKFALRTRTLKVFKEQQKEHLSDLALLVEKFENLLRYYNGERLGTFVENGITYSTQLSFYNFLITNRWQRVQAPITTPLHSYIGSSWIYTGHDMMEIRSVHGSRFAKGLDIKEYSGSTYAGILNQLLFTNTEFVMTLSFNAIPKQTALSMIETQEQQLQNAEDSGTEQIDQLDLTKNMLQNGEIALGEMHFSLIVFGDTPAEAKKACSQLSSKIEHEGYVPVDLTIAKEGAFFAQLPANWKYRPRPMLMTSLNFCGLTPLHNFQAGKRDRNPWGQAVTLFNSPSEQPLYFNFHGSDPEKDSRDEKISGNTLVIGVTGSGKTTFIMFILAQLTKFANNDGDMSMVVFDKDRGAELAIRALGGNYYRIEPGIPTGWNPFQMTDNATNRRWLKKFVRGLVFSPTETPTDADLERISAAVDNTMTMPFEYRRLSTVLQNTTMSTSGTGISVYKRLEKWTWGHDNGWLFDNETDLLSFDKKTIHGFDGTRFLDDKELIGPITSYMIHRVEGIIDGRKFPIIFDEAWKWFDDRGFDTAGDDNLIADFAKNKQFTIRKQNGLGVYMTQDPEQFLQNKICGALIKQSVCKILLPNPGAKYEDYVEGLGITEEEFEIVRKLDPGRRQFLYKNPTISAVGEFNLAGDFGDEIAILSGDEANVRLFDKIVEELGTTDPDIWIPVFQQRRRERTQKV